MNVRRYEIVTRRDTCRCLSLDAVASRAGIHPGLIEQLMECALIEPLPAESRTGFFFDVSVVPRLRMIERLRCDLGINLAGVAVILDMLDRMRALRKENEILRTRAE